MSDLRELYEDMIKDHCKRPRHFHKLDTANRQADGHNRLCGDKMQLYVKVENGVIQDIAFEGDGCCISRASSSMMTDAVKGKTLEQVNALYERFHDVLTGPPDEFPQAPELGKLAVFAGVRKFPVRVKCATLPWHTLQAALKNEQAPVSTE